MKRSTPTTSARAATSSAQSARRKRAPTRMPRPWPRWSRARTRNRRPRASKVGNQLRSAVAPRPCRRTTVGAPGGPLTSRTNVLPRPGSSTIRPGGSGTGGAAAVSENSDVDSDDLDLQQAARRLVFDDVARVAPDERLAERGPRGDHRDVVAPLLDRADEIALGVVVALVADGDDRAGGDGATGGAGSVDDLGALEHRLQLADARLHLALVVLGRVVVAVLGQVTEL